ncbi:MAG: cytochrome b/b6 domain-containing protein [Hamadaea sp.]|uniref:cytochrome b/b6 domain-containing protein n=1 Tax=Hamadaea sp. TaxID=2024425 RepID=UPI00182BDD58|nr:cytochrome b/b6 domain-containing protein [Hamadaea sp.]NUT18827.1 cytochrome b/b6 domain-containing protein [Hamadaea sp.]
MAFIERYSRRTRWFHAGIYVAVLVLLATGWWLALGREGRPSPLARVTGLADTTVHLWTGWGLAGLAGVAVTVGVRAAGTFLVESVRFRRGDLRWFVRWPAAVWTGRFASHDGHFDPGQRVANLVLTGCLAVLIGSGVGLAFIDGGIGFVVLRQIHRWATFALTPVVVGHIVIASGILPGYRGVARSMHGGRLRVETAKRVWPGWLHRTQNR